MEHEKWHWQEPGTAWRGVGVYHITLTVPSREPLLGTLVIPEDNPQAAWIERTALGDAVIKELYVMGKHYPAIRILQFSLMPDHLHAVIHVTKTMETSIRSVIRGYWQGVKKHGRAYTSSVKTELNSVTTNEIGTGNPSMTTNEIGTGDPSMTTNEIGKGYSFPIFTERPFIRPLSRRGQLQTMIRYIQMNPQRLATKRLKPGFFRVQKGIEIGGKLYDGVGNVALLMYKEFDTVHVRSMMVKTAEYGDSTPLRNYMNNRVLMARKQVVMISPFISTQEKQVMMVLLQEGHPFILLLGNGFNEYYKPADTLFDACAAGRLLILSPWAFKEGKHHISRSECVALNAIAEEICQDLNNGETGTLKENDSSETSL